MPHEPPHEPSLALELPDPRREDRVRRHTAPQVNDRIDRATAAAIEVHALSGREALRERLAIIDREWDVDRALMANFAVLGGLSYALGGRSSAWRLLFRVQLVFLLVHAIVGWCPPLPVFRRLGYRTAKEIAAERAEILRRLRGLGEPA